MAPATDRWRPLFASLLAFATVLTVLWLSPSARAETSDTCEQVSIVLDESGSIGSSEVVVRQALHAFLDPLAGYSLDASIVEFGNSATTVFGYTEINPGNLNDVFDPYVDNTGPSLGYDSPSQLGPWTNWDDALDEVSLMADGPDLVLFITDGDPTAYNQDQVGETGGPLTNADTSEATNRAVEEANQIRSAGSDIIAIAVGNALTNAGSLSRLESVAGGGHQYPDDGPLDLALTDVVRVPDFADLPETLALIAQQMCANPGISIEKSADQTAVTVGSDVTYEITVTNTGSGPLSNVQVSDPLVPECSATIDALAEGASTTFSCTTTLWGQMTNTATASGEDPFGTPVSDDDSATVEVIAPGTGTPGYWKNHTDVWPMIGDSIYIGDWNHNWQCDPAETCLELSSDQALAALNNPPKGDMTWNLARALVAAWLNVSAGNDASCIATTIELATGWLDYHGLGGGVAGGDAAWVEASGWAADLDDYNNGLLCAEHRDAGGSETETGTATTGNEATDATEREPAVDGSSQQEGEGSGPASPNGKGKAKGRG